MLTGVIVGVAVAVIAGIVRAIANEGAIGQMTRIFKAQRAGGIDAARAEVDKTFKPTLRLGALAPRFAALALIGDRPTLEREVAAFDGPIRNICLAKSYGLLGLVVVGDPTAPARLAEHAAVCERELPCLMAKIKVAIRGTATIGAAVVGGSSEPVTKLRPGLFVFGTPWIKALVWEASARAFERDGKPGLATNTREHLAHLARAKAAA